MSPQRIAFCITELDPGGAERALVQLVTRLDREEWSPTVICLSAGRELVADLEAADVPVICLGAKRSWNLSALPKLTRMLRELKPDILQTWLVHANILGRLAGKRCGVPIIVSGVRVAERRGGWRVRLDRWTRKLATHHVCVSQAVADFMIERVKLPADRVTVIPNGVDFERFANAPKADFKELNIPLHAQTFVAVGRLDAQKNPAGLLNSFSRICTVHPDAHLLYVGDGPLMASLREQAEGLGLDSRVHLVGRRGDVPAILRSATALLLASRWEGMPNVVLEAMASGCPVIATDVEGVCEVVTNGETGVIVPVEDTPALAEAMNWRLEHVEESTSMANRAQSVVKERFTWESVCENYVNLYRELIENSSETGPKSDK